MNLDWSVLWTNREALWHGALLTVALTVLVDEKYRTRATQITGFPTPSVHSQSRRSRERQFEPSKRTTSRPSTKPWLQLRLGCGLKLNTPRAPRACTPHHVRHSEPRAAVA